MGTVTDIRTRSRIVQDDAPANGLPVFKGEMQYEESAQDDDFASFVINVAMQMPERSRRNFLSGLEKIDELCTHAQHKGDYRLIRILDELGFITQK